MNAPLSIRPDFEPGRLWSLWDMLTVKAARFYELSAHLANGRTYLELQMRDAIDSKSTLSPLASLVSMQTSEIINQSDAGHFIAKCEEIIELCREINAPLATMAARRLIGELNGSRYPTYGKLAGAIENISSRLKDELSLVTFVSLNVNEAEYFQPTQPLFGSEFDSKFNSRGLFELDEAAKCLALGRPTACVFHLMRIMEIGIQAIARCLQIPDPVRPADRNWGKILDKIRDDGIKKQWPTAAVRAQGDGKLFEELLASLDAVRNPWRNSTMHVENKYTPDEAEHIFVAVKGFMKKVASRMDEEGLPFA